MLYSAFPTGLVGPRGPLPLDWQKNPRKSTKFESDFKIFQACQCQVPNPVHWHGIRSKLVSFRIWYYGGRVPPHLACDSFAVIKRLGAGWDHTFHHFQLSTCPSFEPSPALLPWNIQLPWTWIRKGNAAQESMLMCAEWLSWESQGHFQIDHVLETTSSTGYTARYCHGDVPLPPLWSSSASM